MRRLSVWLTLLLICTMLCSCYGEYRVDVEGLDNYDRTEGYVEINVHLLPTDDFLKKYSYTAARYNHKEIFKSRLSITATECSLVVAHYDAEQYALAKEFCLQNIKLINSFEYNGYVFAENIMLAIGQNRLNEDGSIVSPEWFNMFAYNDKKCCLVFLGAHILDGIKENTKTEAEAWGEFLQKYFYEFYAFD